MRVLLDCHCFSRLWDFLWNILEYNSDPELYRIAPNFQTITIGKAGFYQICIRLTNNDSGQNRAVMLRINNAERSVAYNGFNTGLSGSVHLNDIMQLNTGDAITVYFQSNQNLYNDGKHNVFWINKIA